jgi:hypothetical protein
LSFRDMISGRLYAFSLSQISYNSALLLLPQRLLSSDRTFPSACLRSNEASQNSLILRNLKWWRAVYAHQSHFPSFPHASLG